MLFVNSQKAFVDCKDKLYSIGSSTLNLLFYVPFCGMSGCKLFSTINTTNWIGNGKIY